MEKLRILVADAHSDVRYSLQVALPQMKGIAVEAVDEVTTVEDLPAWVAALRPDLLLLDWQFPRLTESHLVDIRRRYPPIRIIALSTHPEAQSTALTAGVDAFINKGDGAEPLLEAIQRVAAGR
jgi:DNA-binding NarL/FixJ family response regulator